MFCRGPLANMKNVNLAETKHIFEAVALSRTLLEIFISTAYGFLKILALLSGRCFFSASQRLLGSRKDYLDLSACELQRALSSSPQQ